MADVAKLLESLHPMREPPPPVSIAPMLLMASLGCVVAAVVLGVWWRLRRKENGLRRSAALALAESRALVPAERLAAQARLLRRLVRVLAGEAEARRQGDAWLATLDRAFATTFFTAGEGRIFGDALYAPQAAPDVEAIDGELARLFAAMVVAKQPDPAPAIAPAEPDRKAA